jgi:GTPase SAR1 family protein
VIVITGPEGVGKTSVAQRIVGEDALRLDDTAVHRATVRWLKQDAWDTELAAAPELIIDGPVFLPQRLGAARALADLVRRRTCAGLRTVLCEGGLADGSVALLMDAVELNQRVTLTLRFPKGGGRRRFAQRMCDARGLDRSLVRSTMGIEPWSYAMVIARLDAKVDA